MPRSIHRMTAGVACHLLLWCCLVSAQDGSGRAVSAAESPNPRTTGSSVEEVWPEVTWLPDEEKGGDLQAIIGFSYQEFMTLYRLKEGLAQRELRPRYSIQQMSAVGRADAQFAELTIDFKIIVRDDDWVRVPLRLDAAILRETAVFKGSGEYCLDVQRDADGKGRSGYICWIRGPSDQPHELTLKMLVPVTSIGEVSRLRLLAPRATASDLTLTVPIANATGRVSDGARLEPPSGGSGGKTQFTVRGLGGDFELTWQEKTEQVNRQLAVLKVEGSILVRIDRLRIDTTANLSVSSFDAPFDQFRVRLPQGAELVPLSPTGYSVEEISADLVEVRLDGKTSGPVEVRLATTRSIQPSQSFELAGFEVVSSSHQSAQRQSGHVDVVADSDWQVLWGSKSGATRVEPSPHEGIVGGFDYFVQPYSLTARLMPRETRIALEPEYLLLVGADEVRLEANLKYNVRGAKAYELDFALPAGWIYDDSGPSDVVDTDRVSVADTNVISLPLLQPATGKIELRVHAHWPIPQRNGRLEIPLPKPQFNSPGPAVVIVPDDDIELIPDHERMTGLIHQQIDPQMQLPPRQQAPLFYRGEASDAVFAATLQVHGRSTTVEVSSHVVLDPQAAKVEQELDYTIKYEPADHFTVRIPRELATANRLKFFHEGKLLPPPIDVAADLLDDTGTGSEDERSKTVRKWVVLPEGQIGSCKLVVQYSVPSYKVSPNEQTRVTIPLVMPAEGELLGNRLDVTAGPEIEVAACSGPWTAAETGTPTSNPPRLLLSAEEPTEQVELQVALENGRNEEATVVERAWVQTWLTDSARQDRVVFSFTSSRNELRVAMPHGATLGGMEVWLDDRRLTVRQDDEGRLIVPLFDDAHPHHYVLELRPHFPLQRSGPGRMSIEIPKLGDDVWIRRLYWELVLPRDEHVMLAPKGFTSECNWEWLGYFWGRRPLLESSELETWVGVSNITQSNPEGTNRYLFSTMGDWQPCEFRTASRFWIVLIASGGALIAGLLLIYVPASRHPGTLFAAGIGLLCAGLLFPEPTLLVAQAAILGLVLTLVAGLLQHSVARRRRTILPEISSSILEKGSTQTQYQPPTAPNLISTQTAAAVAPPSDSNA